MSSQHSAAAFGVLFCLSAAATPAAATTLIYNQTGLGESGGPGFTVSAELDFTGPELPTISFSGLAHSDNIFMGPNIADLAAEGLTSLHVAYAPPPPKEQAREFNLIDLTFTTDFFSWSIAPGPTIRINVNESPSNGRGAETLDIRGGQIRITDDFQCGSDCSAVGEWLDPPDIAATRTVPEPGSLALLITGILGIGIRQTLLCLFRNGNRLGAARGA